MIATGNGFIYIHLQEHCQVTGRGDKLAQRNNLLEARLAY